MKLIRTFVNGFLRECNVDDKTAGTIRTSLDEMYPRKEGESFWSFEDNGNEWNVYIL